MKMSLIINFRLKSILEVKTQNISFKVKSILEAKILIIFLVLTFWFSEKVPDNSKFVEK
jgi:hypothetical protein